MDNNTKTIELLHNEFIKDFFNPKIDNKVLLDKSSELLEILNNQSQYYNNKIKNIDIRTLMLTTFYKWFDINYISKTSNDDEMGFIFFVYSLILNDKNYTNTIIYKQYIKEFTDELFEFFTFSRNIQIYIYMLKNNMRGIKTNPYNQKKNEVYYTSLINNEIASIHGMQFYDYQLKEYIEYLEKELAEYTYNKVGYKPSIIIKLYFQALKLLANNNIDVRDKYIKLLLYPLHDKYIEYNNYFKHLSCNLGDNNNNYLLPLDKTILNLKPFIKIEENNNIYYINPFFHKVGLAMGVKLLDKYLFENNKRYKELKSAYCENKTLQLLKTIFGKQNCFFNVFYEVNGKNYEIDTLIIYKPFILYFEAKSNNITDEQKNDMKKYYKKLGENFIKKGCLQIGRFYDKLRNNGKIMIYRDNKCKEKISKIDNKFIFIPFIITFSDFSFLDGNTQNLTSIFNNKNEFSVNPIIINLSELEIVSSILCKEYEFINYFLQRIEAINDIYKIKETGTEEIIQLGFYLEHNNIPYIHFRNTGCKHIYIDQSFRENIDNCFCYRLDNKPINIPSVNIDEFTLNLLKFISNNSKFNQSQKNILTQWILFTMQYFIENIRKGDCNIKNIYDYIEKIKLKNDDNLKKHHITYIKFLSEISKNKCDFTFLFSLTIHKNYNDDGEFNKSSIIKLIEEDKNITHFIGVSYCIDNNTYNKFNIFSIFPEINPYKYFNFNGLNL